MTLAMQLIAVFGQLVSQEIQVFTGQSLDGGATNLHRSSFC